MGKSRLIAEFVRNARRRGLFVAFGECQSFGTNTSYFVWREIARRLFGLEDGERWPHDREAVEATLTAHRPGARRARAAAGDDARHRHPRRRT